MAYLSFHQHIDDNPPGGPFPVEQQAGIFPYIGFVNLAIKDRVEPFEPVRQMSLYYFPAFEYAVL